MTHLIFIFAMIPFIFNNATAFAANYSFSVCGTGDSQILLQKLAEHYQTTHPDITINIQDSVGSSGGIRKVASGECELGRVARNFNNKELQYNLKHQLFAYSAIAFITSSHLTIDTISTKQVVSILSGETSNWKKLGGDDAPIYIVNRERGDSSRTVLEENIPALNDLSPWAGKMFYTTTEAVQAVERHENTFSFAPLAVAKAHKVQILNYNGINPSPQNIKSGKYPLVVSLGLVWKDVLNQPVQEFVDFIISPSAQTIISDNGAIPAK
nr:substrate-binding domain-containing protein [Desulfobulbaceae bacterium]